MSAQSRRAVLAAPVALAAIPTAALPHISVPDVGGDHPDAELLQMLRAAFEAEDAFEAAIARRRPDNDIEGMTEEEEALNDRAFELVQRIADEPAVCFDGIRGKAEALRRFADLDQARDLADSLISDVLRVLPPRLRA